MTDAGFRVGDTIIADLFDSKDEGGYGGAEFAVQISSVSVERGGMSTLLLGDVQTVGGQRVEVAVKVVHTADKELARSRKLFLRELSAVQRARHNFIVPFFGAADLGDRLVIISPFMHNGNLLRYVREHPQADRLVLVFQVAAAVCHMHTALGIVHGDLKCENVLVSDGGNALVTDFGLSTLIDKPVSEDTTITAIREGKTVPFAAPELLLDDAKSDSNRIRSKTPQSDVYAFGMLILQAFTGSRPWTGRNNHQIAVDVLAHKLIHPRPNTGALSVEGELWDLCVVCWLWDPASRPTMDHVRDSLAMLAHTRVGANDESPLTEIQPLLSTPGGSVVPSSEFEFILLTQARGTARRRRVIMLQFRRAAAVFFF